MVNRRRRAPRSRRGTVPTNASRIRRVINRSTHGMRITPSVDPPDYAAGPWWPITVIMKASSDSSATAASIYDQILKQLAWDGYANAAKATVPLLIRVLSVRAWGLGKQPIQLGVYDHLGGKHQLAEISDYGTPLNYSRVGWKFGNIGVNDAMKSTEKDIIFAVSGATADNAILCYVQCLIRTEQAPKPTLVSSLPMADMVIV